MKAPAIWPAVEYAYSHPEILVDANRRWAKAAPGIFYEHKRELSASSVGHCVLERWAHLHDKLDLPETYDSMLARMDGGTMYGARIAALFSAGYEATHPGAEVGMEVVSEYDGIPGHIDILIFNRPRHTANADWAIEVKTSYWTGDFTKPLPMHFVQAAVYALGVGAPGFSIFTLLPAAPKRGGVQMPFHAQTDEFTRDHADAARSEIARLRQAEGIEPPKQDVKEAFWCQSCRAGWCPKNVNPLKPKTKVLA